MCMKREDDDIDRLVYPFPLFDFIDLTMDEFGEDDRVIEVTPLNDQRNFPYNLLPSSDEGEPARGFIDYLEDSNEDFHYTESNDSPNDINQNTSTSNAESVNINFNTAETNNTGQSSEDREFDLNIPQILLSMSRISNNLLEHLNATSHD